MEEYNSLSDSADTGSLSASLFALDAARASAAARLSVHRRLDSCDMSSGGSEDTLAFLALFGVFGIWYRADGGVRAGPVFGSR